jgi:signal transduction histidine kinase
MMLDAFQMKLMKRSPASAKELGRLRGMLERARDNARNLAKTFYPVELERRGLTVALQELAVHTQERFGLSCVVEAPRNVPARPKDARAIQLFRIAQEAVHNAVKHSQAKHIQIRLSIQDGTWLLTVKDDGVGLRRDPNEADGMGMRIMQYRARMIGATLSVANGDRGGAIVSCAAPAEKANRAQIKNASR